MIVGNAINLRELYEFGEKAVFFVPVDDTTKTYEMTVYGHFSSKYLDELGRYSDSPVVIPLPYDSLQEYGDVLKVEISTYYLTSPDFLIVKIYDRDNPTDSVVVSFEAGKFYAHASDMITVYGYLYNARGEPVKNEPITFTVMNSATYFDNSPLTSMTATAITDNQGKFEISLNRAYDYLLTVNKFNYTKVLKLSSVPLDVETIEVIVGRGLVCES